MLSPGIIANFERGLTRHLEVAREAVLAPSGAPLGRPTAAVLLRVSKKTFLENQVLSDEVFGPSSLVIACD